MSQEIAKNIVGKAAATLVQDGMVVGLGTGSTTKYFIKHLAEKCQAGLKINAVTSSNETMALAKNAGIPLVDIENLTKIDLTIDGADEVDPEKRMIKGGGGALFREKIIASISHEMVVIVDETKLVDHLGKFPLPVELTPFAHRATILQLEEKGYTGHLRMENGKPYVTDNQNFIFDITLSFPCLYPEREEEKMRSVPGVITTGFFFHMAGRIMVGCPDGHVEIYE